jgi:hypothetical protein
MRLMIYGFMYLYITIGIFISIKLFKNFLGKVLGIFYFALLWMPILIADFIVKRLEK